MKKSTENVKKKVELAACLYELLVTAALVAVVCEEREEVWLKLQHALLTDKSSKYETILTIKIKMR